MLIDDIVNFFMFYSFIGTGVMLLMMGRYYNLHRKLSSPWVVLSLGLMIMSLRSLFGSAPNINGFAAFSQIFIPIVSIIGSVLIMMGIIFILLQKRVERSSLEKRSAEIKDVLDNLHDKYFRKEISEEDMRRMNAELEKELAEIEVKLKTKLAPEKPQAEDPKPAELHSA